MKATVTDNEVRDAADALNEARNSGPAIAPISKSHGITDSDRAYAVQEYNTQRWEKEGRRLLGRKIGLTSEAVQRQLGVNEPDYGMLWGDLAFEDGAQVPIKRFLQPRVEAEVAFVMGRAIESPDVEMDEIVAAIEYVVAAVEIVDSAIADWKITLADTIADNASGGGFVLGGTRRTLDELDLRLCGMILSKNDAVASLGVGAACLGQPLNAVLWLARKMATVGRPLSEGDVVLSGALGPMVSVVAGDRIDVEIQGFPLLHLSFGNEEEGQAR